MKQSSRDHNQAQVFWPKNVVRKLLHISPPPAKAKQPEYSADPDDDDSASDSDQEFSEWKRGSRFGDIDEEDGEEEDLTDAFPGLRRRNSETFRSQYINTKEIRLCIGTWNIGGKCPPADLDIENWLDIHEPADIYVIGFQEIVPLNAGNILVAQDSRPVPKWENIIREALNRVQTLKSQYKSFSDPPSPSKFKPFDDAPDLEDELLEDSDSGGEEVIHPIDEELGGLDQVLVDSKTTIPEDEEAPMGLPVVHDLGRQFSSPKKLDRMNCLKEDSTEIAIPSLSKSNSKLGRTLSGKERLGLSWPEPPLDLLAKHVLERPNSFNSVKFFKSSKSFGTYRSFKLPVTGGNRVQPEAVLLEQIDLRSLVERKRRPQFVKIVSKQMVGIFITIWVRRSLRKHIQNLKVSTVGVGVMGYIGNKGSVSVSMSIYQTPFCFICTHLTSGEREVDAIKRNADVQEIHRRTKFRSPFDLPKSIRDHEKIFWLGDLNYRINLPYEKTRELISKKEWSKLGESDQLLRELRKGRAFDGWSEGRINFPPTYKYEMNSDKYVGGDPKIGRRTPAWCDRILSFGKGIKQTSYRRTDLRISDHRPVTASFVVEVEVFSPRKLQRALTFTDAEIENQEMAGDREFTW